MIAQTTSSLFKGQELKWGHCLSSLGRSVEGVLGQKGEGAGGAMMIFFSGGGFREDWLILRVKPLQGLVGLGGTVLVVRLCPEQSRKRTDRWVVITVGRRA